MTTEGKSALILALPRLHLDFLPQGVKGIWPGLPRPLPGYWQPVFPWSQAQAVACLTDHETAPPPEITLVAASLQKAAGSENLRPDEEAGLANFSHNRPLAVQAEEDAAPVAALRPADAPSARRLAWLQESRVLDMVHLRQRLARAEARQRALFSGVEPEEDASLPALLLNPDESALLPPWHYVLQAAAPFLPQDCALYCTDAALASVLVAKCVSVPAGPSDPSGPAFLPGCKTLAAPLPGQSGPVFTWHVPHHFIPDNA